MADRATNDDNMNEARVGYLTGERTDASLDPFDQAELDAMIATLADPSTWESPSSDLGDRVVNLIAAETRGHTPAKVAGQRRRRFDWVGPAALAAAAAAIITIVAIRIGDSDEPTNAVDATIDLIGTELEPEISGTAKVDARQSGTWILLDLPGLPRRDGADFYQAWLRTDDGEGLVPIGTFHDGENVVLWAGVPIEGYPIVTVTRESVAGPKEPGQGSSGEVVATGRLAP